MCAQFIDISFKQTRGYFVISQTKHCLLFTRDRAEAALLFYPHFYLILYVHEPPVEAVKLRYVHKLIGHQLPQDFVVEDCFASAQTFTIISPRLNTVSSLKRSVASS